jgi:hypothetical protein
MIQYGHSRRLLATTTATVMVLTAACSTPVSILTSPPPPPAESTPTPLYNFDPQLHRNPVTITWDDSSQSFFVGTFNDGTIYRGQLDDPMARVFLEGRRGQTAHGVDVADGRLFVAGGLYREIRVHDLETRKLVGSFTTDPGGWLLDVTTTATGDVWVTDAALPVLWHLTPEMLATGSGTPAALPTTPEIAHTASCDNLFGIVALTDQRFVVIKHLDGTLYRIDVDPQAPNGRTIIQIAGVTVPLGEDMILDGRQLVVADDAGLTIVELNEDASAGRLVRQVRDPSFVKTASVAKAADRYLVVNAPFNEAVPDTISSVPAA